MSLPFVVFTPEPTLGMFPSEPNPLMQALRRIPLSAYAKVPSTINPNPAKDETMSDDTSDKRTPIQRNQLDSKKFLRAARHLEEHQAAYQGFSNAQVATALTEALGFLVTEGNARGLLEATEIVLAPAVPTDPVKLLASELLRLMKGLGVAPTAELQALVK